MTGPSRPFAGKAASYAAARPGYPPGALAHAIEGLGTPDRLAAADVGAGTGISSLALAALGVRVFAVEPDPTMSSAAAPHPRITPIQAPAERTGLAAGSVDLVLCAQAYHWFDPEASCAEFRRILRPPGRLALLWNDPDEDDPATHAYARLLRDAAGLDDLPHRDASLRPRVVGFTNHRELTLPNAQRLDRAALLLRARSASYFPKDDAAAARLEQDLARLHARRADASGLLTLSYRVRLHLYDPA
jgi:SAM-dependent methyltransferase